MKPKFLCAILLMLTGARLFSAPSNVIFSDYPDVDIIRVENTYYMVSTTMHFFPGCPILRSYNLKNWEIASYVYDELDGTSGQKLENGKGIYGQGMWAASLRYNRGKFYISFVANDTHKTYLYTADNVEGPWKKSQISGFYHDMSLLFDDDGKIYVVSGNTNINITEMKADLSGPEAGGLNQTVIKDDRAKVILGYEGAHAYKINGKYYIFLINWPKGKYRTEAVYVSDKIEGSYTGRDILNADFNNWHSGVAQGGIVDSPDGKWYSILFQDHGAMGRMPLLVEAEFGPDGFPFYKLDEKYGFVPLNLKTDPTDLNPGYEYESLYCSGFSGKDGKLHKAWQWNHQPDVNGYKFKLAAGNTSKEQYTITTTNVVQNLTMAKNTLTQRAFTEHCVATVEVDGARMKDGDIAGLCALEGDYGFIGITKRGKKYFVIEAEREGDSVNQHIAAEAPVKDGKIQLKAMFTLTSSNQTAVFSYLDKTSGSYKKLGNSKKLRFTLDHFSGVRFGLFCFSTKQAGGQAIFSNFQYGILPL